MASAQRRAATARQLAAIEAHRDPAEVARTVRRNQIRRLTDLLAERYDRNDPAAVALHEAREALFAEDGDLSRPRGNNATP